MTIISTTAGRNPSEEMICLGNEQRSFFVFEIAPKNCMLDSFVDCEGYSIFSEGFLPTVVDIMVI